MPSTADLLKRLLQHDVEFVIVGGFAAVVHGVSLLTEDVDICINFKRPNLDRLLAALEGLHSAHRLVGETRPLTQGAEELEQFRNLYLTTDWGMIDCLSEISGVGSYDEVRRRSLSMEFLGMQARVLDLQALIDAKKAMTRPKDKQTVLELEAIRSRSKRP